MDRSYMGLDVMDKTVGARKKGGNGARVGARKNWGIIARGWTDIKTIGWEHAVCVVFPYA